MKLSTQDADLFFELMWPLQHFVNKKLRIIPEIQTLDEYITCSTGEKMQVRAAMYKNKELLDIYLNKNPQQLSDDKLEIIASWKQFVDGEFHIERILKKHAIFISGRKVYGVLALYDDFESMLYRGNLPILVKAALLPFKGKIIYDGLLQSYNIYFGGGISKELKEVYMTAKQNSRIIQTFDKGAGLAKSEKAKEPVKDLRPELDELIKKAKALRGSAGRPPIHTPAFSLVKASLEFAKSAVTNADDIDNLYKSLKKVNRAYKSVHTTLHRLE